MSMRGGTKAGEINLTAQKKQVLIDVCTFKVVDDDGMKPAAAAINLAPAPAGLSRAEPGWTADVTGYFSHHVRWGAARHPGASPGPRGLSHWRTTPIFPLFVSLVGGEGQRELAAAGWSLPGNWLPPQALGSSLVGMCSGASSSLLHNHFLDYFPELTARF